MIRPEEKGWVGTNGRFTAGNWGKFIEYLTWHGETGLLSNPVGYDLSRVRTLEITAPLMLTGPKRDPLRDPDQRPQLRGGPKGRKLFILRGGALHFRHLKTENIALVDGGAMKRRMQAPIDRIALHDWGWEIDHQAGLAAFVLVREGTRETDPNGVMVRNLSITAVEGEGGLAGICVQVPIEWVGINGLTIRNLVAPPGSRKIQTDPDTGEKKMVNIGIADGLNLGEDFDRASALGKGGVICNVDVLGLDDQRSPNGVPRGGLASIDGIRILLPNITMTGLRVRGVRSIQRHDTTGAYFKSQGSHITDLDVAHCGAHEGSVVIKGGGPGKPPGDKLTADLIRIRGTSEVKRGALYLGTDGIHIGRLIIDQMGGFIDRTAAGVPDGYGPLIHMQGIDDKGEISFGHVELRSCRLYASKDTAAIMVQGYRRVSMTSLTVNGLGFYNPSGTRTRSGAVIALASNFPLENLRIEEMTASDVEPRTVVAIKETSSQKEPVGAVSVGALTGDRSFRFSLQFAGQKPGESYLIDRISGLHWQKSVKPKGSPNWPSLVKVDGKVVPRPNVGV